MFRLTTLYFDCFSGASGDMVLGALIDAGVPLDEVRAALGSLAIEPDAVWTERVTRAGITATKFCVRGADVPGAARARGSDHRRAHRHAHEHRHAPVHAGGGGDDHGAAVSGHWQGSGRHHHDEEHRTLAEIEQLIERSALRPDGRARAKQLFRRLAEAEGSIHGTPLERVHLHEVGALDSIIDVVGTVFALEALRVDRVVSSALNVGGGSIVSSHGVYPVPAPATLALLRGAPIYAGPQREELVTPTGALLVTGYADAFGPMPRMRVQEIGYGAGSRDFPDRPNVLRVVLGEEEASADARAVVVMEAEIDDMNPQIFGVLMDRLLAAGALDVFYTPVQMKKNRPGTLLTIVAPHEARERLTSLVFAETTTIGIRYQEMMRECLERETIPIDTPLGTVRLKVARRNGTVMNASPEFDDCVRLAAEHGRPLKDVQALAMKAFLSRGDAG